MRIAILSRNKNLYSTRRLVEEGGGKIVAVAFVIELDFLSGRKKLQQYSWRNHKHF